ncbi:hypothetical protein GE21DRAFT_8543 [Neurospora crassa]|uniref:Uncharacterized protein n=1 Tax=Neurospora crassa (strain ATCC 24698 / 74-OR23-1A / CBS 708.71 / DSM 1257 / FGSC 987) TaxID=367110 RepID=Q7RZ26_NEUCR|nr:hypothetical protein NCU07145 [Neurospora crassa OR74A]EAA28134.1 hypothetical protein NCU07145 [Neurospora crassa OR74A]KHE85831.1 hypothetical protein GE21DRAFT_8543 [Neurospora crassa]|eukprot:XP_957370.1 hypothetical protein NCU07145 [Neurospora crassa OR74A]
MPSRTLWKKHKDLPQSQSNVLFDRIEISCSRSIWNDPSMPGNSDLRPSSIHRSIELDEQCDNRWLCTREVPYSPVRHDMLTRENCKKGNKGKVWSWRDKGRIQIWLKYADLGREIAYVYLGRYYLGSNGSIVHE